LCGETGELLRVLMDCCTGGPERAVVVAVVPPLDLLAPLAVIGLAGNEADAGAIGRAFYISNSHVQMTQKIHRSGQLTCLMRLYPTSSLVTIPKFLRCEIEKSHDLTIDRN
jgi:hypothetical protein